jgi:hypothetical protein
MRKLITNGGIVTLCALCALLACSCDLAGSRDHSFFNPVYYRLDPGEADGLTAAGADGRITVAWKGTDSAEYYEVFYGTTSDVRALTPLRVTGTT